MAVFKIDPNAGTRLGLSGDGDRGGAGWVDLEEPIIVQAGDTFIAVPLTRPLFRRGTDVGEDAI